MLLIDNLSKAFGGRKKVQALKSVSLRVSKGEIVGFVGLNGAGKTTTIRIVAGVIRPTSGTVTVDGFDAVTEHEKAAQAFSWVPENPVFDPTMTGREFLKYISKFSLDGISSDKADEALQRVGLLGASDKKIKGYSLGMKRRLALAQAFLQEPRLILMDEAMNGLDPEGMNFFRETVRAFRNGGGAVLLSSHVLSEVAGVSDRVSFIHKGVTVETKSITELEKEFRSTFGSNVSMEVEGLTEEDLLEVAKVSGRRAGYDGRTLELGEVDDAKVAQVNRLLVSRNFSVLQIRRAEFNLEQLFLRKVKEWEAMPRT